METGTAGGRCLVVPQCSITRTDEEDNEEVFVNTDVEANMGGQEASVAGAAKPHGFKKIFQNAVRKNNIIHKIQVLQEEKDHVVQEELTKASEGAKSFKERFQKSRPNSICDPVDMVPASAAESANALVPPAQPIPPPPMRHSLRIFNNNSVTSINNNIPQFTGPSSRTMPSAWILTLSPEVERSHIREEESIFYVKIVYFS